MKIIIPAAFLLAILSVATFVFMPLPKPAPAPALAADELDYVGQLPNPIDLCRDVPGGAKVSKIVQTAGEVTVTYAGDNGQSRVVSYRLLPTGAPAAPKAPATVQGPAVREASADEPSADKQTAPANLQAAPANAQVVPAYYRNAALTNGMLYQQPLPPVYNPVPSYTVVYQQPPLVYNSPNTAYSIVNVQPAPVYEYDRFPAYDYGYYPVYSIVGWHGGTRHGFHNIGHHDVHFASRGVVHGVGRR